MSSLRLLKNKIRGFYGLYSIFLCPLCRRNSLFDMYLESRLMCWVFLTRFGLVRTAR